MALCALQAFWFTEAVIGRLSYPARIAGFGLTGLPALVLCAALGGWFPLDNIGAWVSFVAIYLVTLAAITAGYTIYYRRTAGSFDAALAATAKAGKSRPSRREAITSVLVRAFPARKAECADLVGNLHLSASGRLLQSIIILFYVNFDGFFQSRTLISARF